GGRLLVKDVDTRPAPKRWFTWALDRVMAPHTPVHYWSAEELTAALEHARVRVRRHLMVDVLPYPHVPYIGEPRTGCRHRCSSTTGSRPGMAASTSCTTSRSRCAAARS